MFIIWILIVIVSLVSALIIQQELRIGWGFWNKYGGSIFFNNLSSFSPQRNDDLKYPLCPSWEWKLGSVEIDINYYPDGDIKDSIGKGYSPIIFKLGKFYILIWS